MNIVLIGYSGHGKVVAEVILLNNFKLNKYLDLFKKNHNPYNLEYMGKDSDENLLKLISNGNKFIIGIGDNITRDKIFKKIINLKGSFQTVVHPSTFLSKSSQIGSGSFISSNVCINASTKILDNCIINTSVVIEHDCYIKSSVHVAPGAVICGNVEIGEKSFIGANSTIKEGVKIGSNSIIGAGSLVLKNVPDNSLFYGNPGKIIK